MSFPCIFTQILGQILDGKGPKDLQKHEFFGSGRKRRPTSPHMRPLLAHILLGRNFNMPGVDWSEGRVPTGTPHRKQARLLLETMQELNLTQVVDIPTRGTNTLDLLFTDVPSLISKIHSAPGLSDHDTILVDHKLKATINKKAAREVPLFNKADWPSLREKVRLLALDYINANPPENRRSLTNNWLFLKGSLLGAIEQFIHRKKVGTRFNLPYLTPKTKRKIRKRQ